MTTDRISERLEHVRARRQVPTLKDFHERLRGDGEYAVSYSAVRNYHFVGSTAVQREQEREAPPAYLARVSQVFDICPEWLLTGEGPVTTEERELLYDRESTQGDWLITQIREEVPQLNQLDYSVAVAFVTYLQRWVKAHLRVDYQVGEDEVVEYAASVWEHLNVPLNAWARRLGKQIPLDPLGASDYMMAAIHALNFSLQIVAPGSIDFDTVQSWPDLEDTQEED